MLLNFLFLLRRFEDMRIHKIHQLLSLHLLNLNMLYEHIYLLFLDSMLQSDDKIERYWVNECLNKLRELDKFNDTYLNI